MTSATPLSTDLKSLLESVGVAVSRAGEREITGKCPVHERVTGKPDKSPSWSINATTGLWICFSCGARGTLSSLLTELSGDIGLSAQQFLIQSELSLILKTRETENEEQKAVADINAYYGFSRVSDLRCAYRDLNPDVAWRFGIRWNPEEKSWIIPIVSPKGEFMGWQAKKSGWVRNRPNGVEKGSTFFGIERLRSMTAILVESPLDVVRLASLPTPLPALASFGAHLSNEQCRLVTEVCDKVIVAMDNDKAGIEASQRLHKNLATPRHGIRWWNYSNTTAKDIGDMSDKEIYQGYKTSTSVPPWITKGV